MAHDKVEDAGGYVPQNILITGAAGFIASHVATRLTKTYSQYKIVVIDKLDYCSSLKNLDSIKGCKNFKFVKGDITSADLINYVMKAERIDTVMHFAAQTHVDNSFGNSFAFTHNNVYGTHVLLESAKNSPHLRRFIHVSTDEVYGETPSTATTGYTEQQSMDPSNPYSATKAGAEMIVRAYAQSYKLPIIVTRGNNVYGPGQYPEKLIPKFCMRALAGQTLPVHGTGSSVRSYLYVEDVAEAFDAVLHRGVVGDVYNISTQKERSVLEVAQEICKVFGLNEAETIQYVEDRPFNDCRYFLEDSKLAALGWTERTPWDVGIKRTIDFYRNSARDFWPHDISQALKPHPYAAEPIAALEETQRELARLAVHDEKGQGVSPASFV